MTSQNPAPVGAAPDEVSEVIERLRSEGLCVVPDMIERLAKENEGLDAALGVLHAENKKLHARIAELEKNVADYQKLIHTNTDRTMTMEHRFFVAENGFIGDENFDFDVSMKVSGDFVDDEKRRYAQMIACTLNDYGTLKKRITELEADAKRYAFMVGGCPFAETDPAWDTKESLDAAIDRAMQEGEK